MSKKNFDYKVTVNFEMSGHAQLEYQTDKMIKASLLQMLKQYLDDNKKLPKYLSNGYQLLRLYLLKPLDSKDFQPSIR